MTEQELKQQMIDTMVDHLLQTPERITYSGSREFTNAQMAEEVKKQTEIGVEYKKEMLSLTMKLLILQKIKLPTHN